MKDFRPICVECGQKADEERDIALCEDCVNLFDLETLWNKHDRNELDAIKFNESENLRERFRK